MIFLFFKMHAKIQITRKALLTPLLGSEHVVLNPSSNSDRKLNKQFLEAYQVHNLIRRK